MGTYKRETVLKWGSIVLLIASMFIIYFGMTIIQNKVDNGQSVTVADHSKSDIMILFGSMLFGISGGMLTNIFTVYDNKYYDLRFDKLETILGEIKKERVSTQL
jgi:uncharacterized membrane protein